jgi:hypothetical protein
MSNPKILMTIKHEAFPQPIAALKCSKNTRGANRSFGTVSEAIRPLLFISTAAHPRKYHVIKITYILLHCTKLSDVKFVTAVEPLHQEIDTFAYCNCSWSDCTTEYYFPETNVLPIQNNC